MFRKNLSVTVILLGASLGLSSATEAGCNFADLLFGKVEIKLIREEDYEIGIVFGADFDSKRFLYGRILGQIAPPERDGSRRITDVNTEVCGVIEKNMRINTEEADC